MEEGVGVNEISMSSTMPKFYAVHGGRRRGCKGKTTTTTTTKNCGKCQCDAQGDKTVVVQQIRQHNACGRGDNLVVQLTLLTYS